jgi:hypothetical protein
MLYDHIIVDNSIVLKLEYKLQINSFFEIKTEIIEGGISNLNGLQNNVPDNEETHNSSFCVFISAPLIFSIFVTDTYTPILNHVRPACTFRRFNTGVGPQ